MKDSLIGLIPVFVYVLVVAGLIAVFGPQVILIPIVVLVFLGLARIPGLVS